MKKIPLKNISGMSKKDRVIAIVGSTASGKSALALQLAHKLNGEIISADSRQIYKEFNIATAKPSLEEREGIAHHLIDIVEPTEAYTVADFCDDANEKIKEIVVKGKTPIIVGGTGLYFRTLLQDFDLPRVEPDEKLREELNDLAKKEGPESLHKILFDLDPDSAAKLHPNNTVKIIRAIEVSKKLNIPFSKAQSKKEAPYDVLWIGLNAENRQFLYDRVDKRVDVMLGMGLLEEAQQLFEKYGELPILMNTIGYQELSELLFTSDVSLRQKMFEGDCACKTQGECELNRGLAQAGMPPSTRVGDQRLKGKATLIPVTPFSANRQDSNISNVRDQLTILKIQKEEAVDKIKQNSRRYAKRQLTWFRQNPDINWIEIENRDAGAILSNALNHAMT